MTKINNQFRQGNPTNNKLQKVLEYRCMTIDCMQPGKLVFSMYNYFYKMMEEIPQDMDSTTKTPATSHLLNNNP